MEFFIKKTSRLFFLPHRNIDYFIPKERIVITYYFHIVTYVKSKASIPFFAYLLIYFFLCFYVVKLLFTIKRQTVIAPLPFSSVLYSNYSMIFRVIERNLSFALDTVILLHFQKSILYQR
ncbi:MAG: hypothetical protein RLZZ323_300 [Bacteroidota bacterium]